MKKLLLLLLICRTIIAGEFVNLTFDEPDLRNAETLKVPGTQIYREFAPVEEALRGWTVGEPMLTSLRESYSQGNINVDYGVSPLSLMLLDIGTASPPYVLGVSGRLHPSDTVPNNRPSFQLAQTGRVPQEAATLRFFNSGGSLEPVFAYINGQKMDAGNFGPNPSLFEVDVLPFAGQEIELAFEFPAGQGHRFDLIGFQAIPEPDTMALFGVGLGWLLLGSKRWKGGISV